MAFVSQMIEVPKVVNPLTVAYSKRVKSRLVRDCRHINQYLHAFKFKTTIESFLYQTDKDLYSLIPVKALASAVGYIIALQNVIGNKTRQMYRCILSRASWNAPVIVTDEAKSELTFWKRMLGVSTTQVRA